MKTLSEWWNNFKKNLLEEWRVITGRCPVCGDPLEVKKWPMAPRYIYDAFDLLDMCWTHHFARTRFYDFIKEHRGVDAEDVINVAQENVHQLWTKKRTD